MSGDAGLLPLHMLQSADTAQMQRMHHAIAHLPDAVHYLLLQLYFPRLLLAQRSQISASGQELGLLT